MPPQKGRQFKSSARQAKADAERDMAASGFSTPTPEPRPDDYDPIARQESRRLSAPFRIAGAILKQPVDDIAKKVISKYPTSNTD